jgi:GT2 family glycosyltransferase
MSLSVSVLITNYNTCPDAERCARSAVEHSGNVLDTVLIVDDCSDTTAPDDLPAPIEVLRNETNQGYVRSVNIGMARLDTDLVILLDSDAEPLMDVVPGVQEAFRSNADLGALSLHLVDREGNPTGAVSPEPTVRQYVLGQKLGAMVRQARDTDATPPPERMCIHSCGIGIRRAAFEDIGGFDEGFDFLDADTDFSMRLRQAGWELAKSDDLVAYHEGGGSPQSTAKRVVRHHRNRWRLLKKHGKLRRPTVIKLLLFLRHLLEYGLLRVAGDFVASDPDIRQDKLAGRQRLLRTVWDGYE